VLELSEDNHPSYPAYSLLGRSPQPRCFELGSVRQIAVATDGLDRQSMLELAETKHGDLSRAMRVIQQSGALEDDSAAVFARRASSVAQSENDASASETLQQLICAIEGI
jgi:hypothetical protein